MLQNVKPEDILFLDVETVPAVPEYSGMSPGMQMLWNKKSLQFRKEEQKPEEVFQRAGIYAEFGKIICISVGVFTDRNPAGFRLKSFFGDDEAIVLKEFGYLLEKQSRSREMHLCAHNGKEFDYPYIARRMIINGLTVPGILDNAGKKPWEVSLLDTMELWKFGDFKSYTSLELLSTVLGIPSPKDDIDGSRVAEVYYVEKDLERIVRYCEKDVLTVAQIISRFMNRPLIAPENVESVTFLNKSASDKIQ